MVRSLGSGAMGAVYEGVHERIRSRVAIKILHANYEQNEDIRRRFFQEAYSANHGLAGPSWTENNRAAAAVRTAGAWLVLLAADRRRRCLRAALTAGVEAPSCERSYKLVPRGRSPTTECTLGPYGGTFRPTQLAPSV